MCAIALISVEADEVGDDEIGHGVRRGFLQSVGQLQLVAFIAQDLAKEVTSRAVVVDDQNVTYAPQAGGFGTRAQF